ncbi:DUF4199 domain-containing protein [Roseivirga sp. BDSF3-8]|uniref:DUF4199 domain-containing protein n=1 Tax=Roseivirga sp. BDSF3-8 TaxID=3241598 RepID=UPI00353191EE
MRANQHLTIERVGIKYGLLTCAGLIGYFLLMKAFNLEHNLELRAFNLIILGSGVLAAVKYFKHHAFHSMTYLRGLGAGMLTSIIAVISFSLLVFIYLSFIQPQFMEVIRNNEPFGLYLNPYNVTAIIVFEGLASGFLLSFAMMQYYKTSHFTNPVDK